VAETLESEIKRLNGFRESWGQVTVQRPSEVVVDDVELSYGKDSEAVLSNVSLTLSLGERVGIVGPSGGGKTSLCRGLLGLLPIPAESLRVDGVLLRDLSLSSWRSLVGFVPQDPVLIRGSIRDNLNFFREEKDDEVLWSALQASNLADDVTKLPNGLDTWLGAGGHEFSGGQRQRLAIARALLGDPKLLVMDEPTSSVDYKSERAIVEAIGQLSREKCLVIVTHRPEIIADCTRLIVVENGRITADGERNQVCGYNDFAHALLGG